MNDYYRQHSWGLIITAGLSHLSQVATRNQFLKHHWKNLKVSCCLVTMYHLNTWHLPMKFLQPPAVWLATQAPSYMMFFHPRRMSSGTSLPLLLSSSLKNSGVTSHISTTLKLFMKSWDKWRNELISLFFHLHTRLAPPQQYEIWNEYINEMYKQWFREQYLCYWGHVMIWDDSALTS